MEPIPDDILVLFNAVMNNKSVPPELRDDYRKWLRYYLDFRVKYSLPAEKSEQVRLFIEKMRSKGKSGKDLHHAAYALSLFFSLQNQNTRYKDVKAVFSSIAAVMAADVPHVSDHIDAACDTARTPACASRRTSDSKTWQKVQCVVGNETNTITGMGRGDYRQTCGGDQAAALFQKDAEGLCRLVTKVPDLPEEQAAGASVCR
jgi:hypothetical protein